MYVTVDPLRPRGDPPGGSKILENQFFAYYSSTILQKSTLLGILLDNYKSNICMWQLIHPAPGVTPQGGLKFDKISFSLITYETRDENTLAH